MKYCDGPVESYAYTAGTPRTFNVLARVNAAGSSPSVTCVVISKSSSIRSFTWRASILHGGQVVLENTQEHVLFVDGFGRKRRARKSGTVGGTRMSMDTYIDFPVKDAKSFREYRHRYEGPAEERYPDGWDAPDSPLRGTDLPLTLMNPLGGTFGYYSMLRNWIGTENLSLLWYDDPALIHECLEFLTDFILRILEPALRELSFDFVIIHEDMAGKGGPLMGPKLFRQFLLPHYKRFVEFLKSNGVQIVLVDTDGDFSVLIPLFLEAGVDGFGPIERAGDAHLLAIDVDTQLAIDSAEKVA